MPPEEGGPVSIAVDWIVSLAGQNTLGVLMLVG